MITAVKFSSNASGAALYGRSGSPSKAPGLCAVVSKALRSSTMSPSMARMPKPWMRRISSHSLSTTSLGSPWPLMYRLPCSVPSRTLPST